MKITAVTPVAAASSPSHPDHAQWVKEQTLAREVEFHGSLRVAETANMRALERLANRKQKPPRKKKQTKVETPSQLAATGVTQKIATARALPPMPACKLCGLCLRCKREFRLSQIATKARQQDQKAMQLITELVAIGFAAQARRDYKDSLGRELPFSRLAGHDRDKAVTAGAEWICDRSTSFMGQWR